MHLDKSQGNGACMHTLDFFWAVSAKLPGYVPMMMADHSAWLLLLLLSF